MTEETSRVSEDHSHAFESEAMTEEMSMVFEDNSCSFEPEPSTMTEEMSRVSEATALLFDQYPELSEKLANAGPQTSREDIASQNIAVEKIDNLDTLLAVRAIADWYYSEALSDCASQLYARVYDCMKKLVGLQHVETFRLLHRWSQCVYREVRCTSPLDVNQLVVEEERCQSALLGLDKVLGSYDSETADCAYTLGHIYLALDKYSLAQDLFNKFYQEHLKEFGAAGDQTLLSLSNLAEAFTLEGNHVQAGLLIWSAPVDPRHQHYSRSSRGEAAYKHQSWESSARGAPKNCHWESKALYCLSIRHVQFQAVYPSDDEKRNLWRPSECADDGSESTIFKYIVEVEGDEYIRLTVPYIPYAHFLNNSSDSSDLPYHKYIKPDPHDFPMPENRDDKSHRIDLPVLHPTEDGMAHTQASNDRIAGFFNGIPGDTAIIYDGDAGIGFNLVSSNWIDYKSFTLHTTAEELTPKLVAADGSMVACHGYISGTWTDFDVQQQWSGLAFFVVDAVFSGPESSQVHHSHFLISLTALQRATQHDMSSDNKRSFVASLNPTLFCLDIIIPYAAFWDGIPAPPDPLKKEYPEEMNRRENWDRYFEDRHLDEHDFCTDPNTCLECEDGRAQEDRRRKDWDLAHMEPAGKAGKITLNPAEPLNQVIPPQRRGIFGLTLRHLTNQLKRHQ